LDRNLQDCEKPEEKQLLAAAETSKWREYWMGKSH
jgi:hypothetical protein